jgi:hypothetical protein
LPGNLSRKLSREFAKGNLLGKFSVIFAGHYLGICQVICHGNLLREFARKFSEILAGNLLVKSLGPLVLIIDYYCLLVLIWNDRNLPAFYVFIPEKLILCIPPFCTPWLPDASSAT